MILVNYRHCLEKCVCISGTLTLPKREGLDETAPATCWHRPRGTAPAVRLQLRTATQLLPGTGWRSCVSRKTQSLLKISLCSIFLLLASKPQAYQRPSHGERRLFRRRQPCTELSCSHAALKGGPADPTQDSKRTLLVGWGRNLKGSWVESLSVLKSKVQSVQHSQQ